MIRNYFNYFTEIEDYFVRRRRKNLLISPMDWCLIELWKENEIPLHVVFRGIDRSFESAEKKQRRPPTTLFYCHPAVMEAFDEYNEAMIGGHPEADLEKGGSEDLSPRRVVQLLTKIERHVRDLQSRDCRRAADRCAVLGQEVLSARQVDFAQLERDLNEIGSNLVRELAKQLDADGSRSIEQACDEKTQKYRKRLSKGMYQRLHTKVRERLLREHFGLPEFSLLQLD